MKRKRMDEATAKDIFLEEQRILLDELTNRPESFCKTMRTLMDERRNNFGNIIIGKDGNTLAFWRHQASDPKTFLGGIFPLLETDRPEAYAGIVDTCLDADGEKFLIDWKTDEHKDISGGKIPVMFAVQRLPYSHLREVEDVVLSHHQGTRQSLYSRSTFDAMMRRGDAKFAEHVARMVLDDLPDDERNRIVRSHVVDKGLLYAAEGKREMLEFFENLLGGLGMQIPFNVRLNGMLAAAAVKGRENVIDFLIEKGADPKSGSSRAIKDAASYGHLEIVKKLFPLSGEEKSYAPIIAAARNGHAHIVDWLRPHTDYDSLRTKVHPRHKNNRETANRLIAEHELDMLSGKHLNGRADVRTNSKGL